MLKTSKNIALSYLLVSLMTIVGVTAEEKFELPDILTFEMSGCTRPIQGPPGPDGPPGPPGIGGGLDHLYAFENLGETPTTITYALGESIDFNTTGPFFGTNITHPSSTTFLVSNTGYYFLNAVVYLDIGSDTGGIQVFLDGAPVPSGAIRVEQGEPGFFLVLQGVFTVPTAPASLTINTTGSITIGNISPATPTPAMISIARIMDI